jgi:porphobilinogen synthase
MTFDLTKRPRRLRRSGFLREIVAEHSVSVNDFIIPLFVQDGTGVEIEIPSMPGYHKRSLDLTIEHVKQLRDYGLKAALLFVQVSDGLKDNAGVEALNKLGLM